jgi:pentatricopeptide repeat protein
METMNYTEKDFLESCSAIFSGFSRAGKIEMMEHLLQSLKNDVTEDTDDFIPEKSAEEIIAEIRESRSFGRTRVIEEM